MISLFLDSAMEDLVLAISKDDKIIYSTCYSCWQRQSELMIPELEKALKTLNITLKDVDEVVCGKGPGSYTGVRIAMTITKVIGTVSSKKIKLISSLQIQGKKGSKFISLMNARGKRSYIGVYDSSTPILEDTILTNDEVLEYIKAHPEYEVVGNVKYLGLENQEFSLVEGLFSFRNDVEPVEDVLSIKPVYLKEAI